MTSTAMSLIPILFAVTIAAGLAVLLVSMVRRGRDAGPRPHEPAAHTWRTAVPWLVMLAVLVVLLLGLYALTR